MIKTKGRLNEVTFATQNGIFFANIKKGVSGLRTEDVFKLNSEMPYGRSSPRHESLDFSNKQNQDI